MPETDDQFSPAQDRTAIGAAVFTVAVFAGTFLWNVAPYWQVNPQYSFGWLVPFLAAFVFVRRWPGRPAPTPVQGRAGTRLLVTAALAFLPIWLVVQPNSNWRLATWAMALEFVAVAMATLEFLGGRAWLRHFAFPVLFLLTAVPWPFGLEWYLVQGLMRGVASVTVEILSLCNIAAIDHGNLIEVRSGLLGVDEACSGIRSLQATLMAGLFLGEFYWLRPGKRALLVAVGLALALICNVGRAFLIAAVAAQSGLDAIARWHDPAGYTILTLCLIGVWAVAQFSGVSAPPKRSRPADESTHRLPRAVYVGVALSLVGSMVVTETWYRVHEGHEQVHWSFQWPQTRAGFTEVAIPERARDALLYDEGKSAEWKQPDGTSWSAFFLRWHAGSTRSRVVPRSHRPEICFPSSGYTMEADYGTRVFQAGGIELPFRVYRFRKDSVEVDVFSCMWQDHPKGMPVARTDHDWSRLEGLEFVRRGERNLSQQVLEFAMSGYPNPEGAERAFRDEIAQMIIR